MMHSFYSLSDQVVALAIVVELIVGLILAYGFLTLAPIAEAVLLIPAAIAFIMAATKLERTAALLAAF